MAKGKEEAGKETWQGFVERITSMDGYEGHVKSREAPIGGVFICRKEVYKCFSSAKQGIAVLEKAKEADKFGIPTGDYKALPSLKSEDGKQTFYPIRISKATGHFFQLSKGGAEENFRSELATMTDLDQLTRVEKIFQAACDFRITDCQFFFRKDNLKDPITFIDVHNDPDRKAPPEAVRGILETVTNRKMEVIAAPVRRDLAESKSNAEEASSSAISPKKSVGAGVGF